MRSWASLGRGTWVAEQSVTLSDNSCEGRVRMPAAYVYEAHESVGARERGTCVQVAQKMNVGERFPKSERMQD
jgi:hypothetical protein